MHLATTSAGKFRPPVPTAGRPTVLKLRLWASSRTFLTKCRRTWATTWHCILLEIRSPSLSKLSLNKLTACSHLPTNVADVCHRHKNVANKPTSCRKVSVYMYIVWRSTNHCKRYIGQPRPSAYHAPALRVLIDRSPTKIFVGDKCRQVWTGGNEFTHGSTTASIVLVLINFKLVQTDYLRQGG